MTAFSSRWMPHAPSPITRVTKPGGRAAVAVWAERDRNPWLGLVLDVLSEQLGQPVPPPGIPTPLSLGDATHLERLFTDTKFADVRLERFRYPFSTPSFDGWWRMTTSLAGPLASIIASLDAETTEKLRTTRARSRRSLRGRRRQPRDPRSAAPGGGASLRTAHRRRWHVSRSCSPTQSGSVSEVAPRIAVVGRDAGEM